jgi:pyruvate kinase
VIRQRKSRIVATLGPASRAPEMVLALAAAGADVFRLNFSHGSHDDHSAAYDAVRAAEKAVGRPLGVLADLQGPKLRVGTFARGREFLEAGKIFRLDLVNGPGDANRAYLPHPEIFAALEPGAQVLIDDGKVRLQVERCGPDFAELRVIGEGFVSDRKGVNVPSVVIPLSPLTPKDRTDLAFALRLGVDWVALSFVQRAEDMAELRRLVGDRAAVLAKIEKPAGLANLDEILDLCHGVMVARGDLGVELAPEDVPVAQKTIVRAARDRGIPVIVATQMLDSMIANPAPTRAEATDVANAVYEGADALMLSGESAAGQYPVQAVEMMDRIISRVERDPRWPGLMDAEHPRPAQGDRDAIPAAARVAGEAARAACLAAYTTSGSTAMRMARERPLQAVVALTPHERVARKLALVWGLEPVVTGDPLDLDDMTRRAVDAASTLGLAPPGSAILVIAGVPFGTPGATNLLRLTHALRLPRQPAG